MTATDLTPDLAAIEATAERLTGRVLRTPTVPWPASLDDGCQRTDLYIKLELLQRTGSFKPRGALNTLLQVRAESGAAAIERITAFSAGNHAIATAFAAQSLQVSARVVMPRSANPFRVERCRSLGAEIEFGESIGELMQIVERLQREEGYCLVHPFEGVHTFAGTATVGLELCRDVAALDAVIVPVGGGGLIAGVASAVKLLQPDCRVIGVEPTGACGMAQSLAAGSPVARVQVDTIADSLGAPLHLPMSVALVQRHVDELVQVTDHQMREAMRRFFTDLKLAVEPACAAPLAALLGPLAMTLRGQRVALIGCGTNIDLQGWQHLVS